MSELDGDGLSFVASVVEEQSNIRTGSLVTQQNLGQQRVELVLPGNSSCRFRLAVGPPGAEQSSSRSRRVYKFDKQDLKVFSKFMHHGKMTFAAPSFGFQLLISGAPHDKLSSMLEKLRYHLSAGSYRPPLVEKTNYSSQAAAAGAGVLTNLKNKRSLDADGLSTRTASPDPRPRLRRACHRGSPSQMMPSSRRRSATRKSTSATTTQQAAASNPTTGVDSESQMSTEQADVIQRVQRGESLFFSGPAGSGKTFVLQALRRLLPKKSTYFLAPTALAAFHIGGCTVHRFAGVGLALGAEPVPSLEAMVRRRSNLYSKWRTVKVLVIDEVSMLSAEVWNSLEKLARSLRDSSKMFGGLQVICCGDFFQLPPVASGGGTRGSSSERSSTNKKRYCFEVPSWKKMFGSGRSVLLRQVFRQQGDHSFINMLNEMRLGKCSERTISLLNSRRKEQIVEEESRGQDGIVDTVLHTHKKAVDKINAAQLAKLVGNDSDGGAANDARKFHAKDSGDSRALKQASAAEVVSLKVGAQVVLVKTVDRVLGLVNGARGVVVSFVGSGPGCRPRVRFAKGGTYTIGVEEWNICVGTQVIATRRQIPLRLAWALSVHKSQGMSIDRAEVCLSNVFEAGQAYVAISRVRTLDGLVVRGDFSRANVFADPRVVRFYKELEEDASNNPEDSVNR